MRRTPYANAYGLWAIATVSACVMFGILGYGLDGTTLDGPLNGVWKALCRITGVSTVLLLAVHFKHLA